MKEFNRPTMLMILDGYGINQDTYGNAIAAADKPHLDEIFTKYPGTTLKACGLDVGLPEGQMGNSEVGHLNIGAGRIVYQDLTMITKAIEDGSFFENEALQKAMAHVKENHSALHLLGLLSDGGVHSHISHLFALIDMAKKEGIENLYVHCFLDGRDVPPRCAEKYISQLEDHMKKTGLGKIATVSGRYYAMDRDKRWDRVEKAYNAMACGEGEQAPDGVSAVNQAYSRDENDEFVLPTVIENANGTVNNGDAMIMFNFRPDRAREITRAFVDEDFDGFERKKEIKDLCYICMTQYEAEMPNVSLAFPPETMANTLGEYIADQGLTQLRIAETEKYAHVTFFFNGGVEEPNEGEDRILVNSPKVATYDLKPEMSAYEVCDKLTTAIRSDKYDVIIINFANPDMVGHTGVEEAAIKAVEAVDECVGKAVEAIKEVDGVMFICADHGNAEQLIDYETGAPFTAHTTNQVPFILVNYDPAYTLRDGGCLADIVPTLIETMGMKQPAEMTGKSLLIKK